jgi:tRNA(adenine34) deaminase
MSTQNTKKSNAHRNSHRRRKWSGAVTTDSTHPQAGLFNQSAKTIARELASKKVSPKGPSSGMRMLNRAGKNLSSDRLKVLENAKKLLHERIVATKRREKEPRVKEAHGKNAA